MLQIFTIDFILCNTMSEICREILHQNQQQNPHVIYGFHYGFLVQILEIRNGCIVMFMCVHIPFAGNTYSGFRASF